ncbi:MAG TPA: hypothetical protein VMH27_11635 [Puia sp.]|nr:hypothetical protein [Puia sp.]
MKQLCIVFLAALVVVVSCQKNSSHGTGGLIGGLSPASEVSKYLKDSLGAASFDSLDFGRAVTDTYDTGRSYYVRVPWRGLELAKRFVLVRTDGAYRPIKAGVFSIGVDSIATDVLPSAFGFYGKIEKSHLNGSVEYRSPVTGGFIHAFHPIRRVVPLEAAVTNDPAELPEIIIYAPDPDNGYDISLELLLDEGGSGGGTSGGSGYSSASGGGSGSAGSSSTSTSSYALSELNELQASKPGIDLSLYFECFGNVPDNSATTYQASLLVKVPNPANPGIMWDPGQTDGVGHTFIQLTKTNGKNSVTQIIGFYGEGGPYAVVTALGYSVPSKMVDNSGHPYNAKLTAGLTSSQFSYLLNELEVDAKNSYNLSSYNCTTYALDAFNMVLPVDLNPPFLAIPGQLPGQTPNGLFEELQAMGSAPAANVSVSVSSAVLTAGSGKGACD